MLTQESVNMQECPTDQKRILIYDEGCRGLLLEIRKSGGKTYYFTYQNNFNQSKLFKIANVKDLMLEQVRSMVDHYRAKVAMGIDPKEEKTKLFHVPHFEEFVTERYLPYAQTYKRSWEDDVSFLKNHLNPTFGKKRLCDIKAEHLIEFIAACKKKYKPGTINRFIALMRYIYNLAIKWEIPGVSVNPVKDIRMLEDRGARERYLTQAELTRLLHEVRHSNNVMLQYIIPMLVLTGARKNEVLNSKWQDINLEKKLWYVEFTKSGKPRYIPLNDIVVSLLETIPHYKCDYIFPNPETLKPFKNIFATWERARTAARLRGLRMHDLRHSFASALVNAGRSLYEVQKLLGHTTPRMTQRYAHLAPATLFEATNCIGTFYPTQIDNTQKVEEMKG